jgi:hypothetical protein
MRERLPTAGPRCRRWSVKGVRGREIGAASRKPQAQWKVLIFDSHPGYICWDDYLRNQQILEDNAARSWGGGQRGAVKRGPALLTGLMRCGRCGRPLHVNYSGNTGRGLVTSAQAAGANGFGGVPLGRCSAPG